MNNQEIDDKIKVLKRQSHIINQQFQNPCPERASLMYELHALIGLVLFAELVKRLPEPKPDVETPEEII